MSKWSGSPVPKLVVESGGFLKMKIRIYATLSAIGGALAVAFPVGAVFNYIDLGETFLADILAYTGDLFSDISPLVILVIGLPLGFWVIRRVIGLVRAR